MCLEVDPKDNLEFCELGTINPGNSMEKKWGHQEAEGTYTPPNEEKGGLPKHELFEARNPSNPCI